VWYRVMKRPSFDVSSALASAGFSGGVISMR
jgi:hypothetical protein